MIVSGSCKLSTAIVRSVGKYFRDNDYVATEMLSYLLLDFLHFFVAITSPFFNWCSHCLSSNFPEVFLSAERMIQQWNLNVFAIVGCAAVG